MEESQVTNTEPIAVIGFAVKFPQQASNSAAFWELLIRGGSARTEVPADRYNAESFYRAGGNAVKTGTVSQFLSRLRPDFEIVSPAVE
jgi:acyl transferase domain-containing protein